MNIPLLVGPLLGFEEGEVYSVCILVPAGSIPPVLEVSVAPNSIAFQKVATVGDNEFLRAEFTLPIPPLGATVSYAIKASGDSVVDSHGRASWTFQQPAANEPPRLAYVSCNGFSSAKLARDTNDPYALWKKMETEHARQPFGLMLMGGDQVYADEIWESRRCPSLRRWSELSWKKQETAKVSVAMAREIAAFYDWLYLDRWKDESMSLMLASIPSVMMWDDHDIFDGWGSYPEERQKCDVFQAVFKEAARVYDVFQLRCSTRNRLNPAAGHRTLRVRFRDYQILALDNRSERSMTALMSDGHWSEVKAWLAGLTTQDVPNLLVMAGVPVVYRSFAAVEATMDVTPWHEELEDDVHDHWSARSHQAERMRLVMILLNFLDEQRTQSKTRTNAALCKGVLLSGDVHVGALGQIWCERKVLGLTQVISSGIVHPPPTAFAWAGIQLMTSDEPEALGDGEVTAEMLTPLSSPRYLRTRNFATLQTGTDRKIWINWICETDKLKPSYAIS